MLKFVLGRSGTGKTEYIINHSCTLAQRGEKNIIIIVPEQHSFSTEKKIIDKIGARVAQNISVLSFSRMTDAVFRQSGGFPQSPISNGMKSVFVSIAIRECYDNLSIYKNQIGKPDFVPMILNTIDEMKSSAISCNQLSAFCAKVSNDTIKQKLHDTSLLLETYNALINRAYSDPLDNLTLIYNRLINDNIFKEATIFVDGFSGFTHQELMIIEVLMCGSKDFYVTLCGSKNDFTSDNNLFRITNETRKSLMRIAKKNFIAVMSPIEFLENKRFHNDSLHTIERNIYSYNSTEKTANSKGITIYQGVTIYNECNYVASEIKRLVTECSYNFSDIAVIARDLSPYRGIINRAFDKNEISYFMENPQPLIQKPLITYLIAILDTICSGFSTEDIFKMLKTGYSSLSEDEIFDLENYSYVWNINGTRWLTPFTQNPEGFKKGFSEHEKERLENIEQSRQRFIKPLIKFRDNVLNKTGAQITKQLYFMLDSKFVHKKLREGKESCVNPRGLLRIQELERIWDILIDSLDQLYNSLKDIKMTINEYARLFKLYMTNEDISYIPQTLDEVTIGTADRIRPDSPKVVFMMGCIQDEFPKNPVPAGIFTDNERCVLRDLGLTLYETVNQLAANELFYVYTSVCAPSERLYTTYYIQTLSGDELKESSIIREVAGILKITDPQRFITEQNDGSFIRCEQDAFEFLASNFNSTEDVINDLKEYFKNSDKLPIIEKIENIQLKKAHKIDSEYVAKKLFGENKIDLSASQIEKFYLCPYKYFCTYGLNIRERKKAEINAAEFGTLVHYILENLLRENTVVQISSMIKSKRLLDKIHDIIKGYLDNYLGGEKDKTKRFLYSLSRIEKGAAILVDHIISELMSCGFDPLCCELKIDYTQNDGIIEPMSVILEDGTVVSIRGMVDRVDKLEKDGSFYIRVVDYKSGKKDFRINDINFGLNLQMLIYLKAITQNGEKVLNHTIIPAGVLYMPAAPNLVSKSDGKEGIDKTYAMDGILIDNGEDVMQTINNDGKYIKSNNIMSQNELKQCFNKIDTLIIHMVKLLFSGNIGATPVKSAGNDACKYCPYLNSCGYENGMESVSLNDISKAPACREL